MFKCDFSFLYFLSFFILCQGGDRLLELTESDPGFAIHGGNLRDLESLVLIHNCQSCSFILDFTQRDCENENFQEDIPCGDPIPFSVNGYMLERDRCDDMIPYTSDPTKYLYSCSLVIEEVQQLIIRPQTSVPNIEYAVAIRVKEWIDATRKLVVLPGERDYQKPNIALIRAHYTAVLVAHPDAIEKNGGPFLQIVAGPTNVKRFVDFYCDSLQDYVTCGDHVEVFVYYGVDRPLANLSKNFLEQTSFADATVIPVRSSVVTVTVNESCSYCLIHAANNVTTTYYSYYEEDQHTYTSYEYPWIFAENAKYANTCWKINIENKLTNKHTILTLNVERIENGALNITGYENLSARSATCDFKKKKNFTRVEQPQIVNTNLQCLEVLWCPQNISGQRTGYLMRTEWNRFYVLTCKSHIYELTEAEPTMAFFGTYLHKLYLRDEEPICLSVKDCFSCDILINIASYCTNEKNSSCEIAPFMINGTNFTLSRCEKNIDSLMSLTAYKCNYEISGQIIINLIDGVDYTRSSISFRAFKWMEDDVGFKMVTMSRNDKTGNIRMKLDKFNDPIWLLLSVGEADWIKYLRKVRWDHHDKDCEYLLIEGSPPGKVRNPSRELAIFRDQDLFIPQFLLSRMYSLLISANCSPTIVMSSEPIEFGKTIPEEELCAGTALIITPYYHKETKDEIVLDFIMYNFYCYRFLIDVIVEVIEVESGVVTLEFRDYFNKTFSRLIFMEDVYKPGNYSVKGVTSIFISMNSTDDDDWPDNTFLRIHVFNPNLLNFSHPTLIPIPAKLTSIANCSNRYSLFSILIFSIFLYLHSFYIINHCLE